MDVRRVQKLSVCTIHLYLYTPHVQYDLYRDSMPGQYIYIYTHRMGRTACTETQCLKSINETLHLLWAVRTLKCLRCSSLQVYHYKPHGPDNIYRASVSWMYICISTILWALRTVQNLSVCTVQILLFSPMSRTDWRLPQCLYNTALQLLAQCTVGNSLNLSGGMVQVYLDYI